MAGDAVCRSLDSACIPQEGDKLFHMPRDFVYVRPAESYIEVVTFSENPSIPTHVPAEEQFGNFPIDLRTLSLRCIHLELDLLGDDGSGVRWISQVPRDRTEVPTSADQHAGADFGVNQPASNTALDGFQRNSFVNARSTATEEKLIELAAPDAVAHHAVFTNFNLRPANSAEPKASYTLDGVVCRIVVGRELKFVEDEWRDPSGPKLIAGKCGAVEHQDV